MSLQISWTTSRIMQRQRRSTAILLLFAAMPACSLAQNKGDYTIRYDQPHQVIRGLGFEIQSDSIASGNAGMPEEVIAVPHDLTPQEKVRFAKEMLHGFRYARLAMGLYLRGLDAEQKHIVERYPGQMADLKQMQDLSGIQGFDVEYWSPAPYWKQNKTYYGGPIAGHDPEFVDQFSNAMVQDLRYLQAHGLRVAQWGLQNEPVVGHLKSTPSAVAGTDKGQSYSTCFYSPEDYHTVLAVTAPKIHALFPAVEIHAPSWDGPAGPYAAEIRKDPALLKQIDAWTWHQIGHNSNDQIALREKYLAGAAGKAVYQNEYEYQPWDKSISLDGYFMNTGQALMNWMTFEDSPVWYWIHALKPVSNVEATGYALGFWRPQGELKNNIAPAIQPGHWDYNPHSYNAIAGFLKYLRWDSTRLAVDESEVRNDQRILVWRSKDGRLGVALSNRGTTPFQFHLHGVRSAQLTGHRYTVQSRDVSLSSKKASADLVITVPPQSFEFWIG
jgi:O-glycosyl hydrolase